MKFPQIMFDAPGAPGAGNGVATPPAPPPAEKPWYEGKVDQTTVGYLQNRGWHTKSAEDVAISAIAAHREAATLIGADPSTIIKLPKESTDLDGWKAVHQRLGAPKEAKDYAFAIRADAEGKDTDAALTDKFRSIAYKHGLAKEAAEELYGTIVKNVADKEANTRAENQVAIEQDRAKLDVEWGVNAAAYRLVAQRAASVLGITPEGFNFFETGKGVGYSAAMNMMLKLGKMLGEDKFISSNTPGAPGVVTPQMAQARLDEIRNDKDWVKRYTSGGGAEVKEFQTLTTIIAGARR